MSFVSRGFRRRHTEPRQEGRVPPGQYVTSDFPVLSAGPTPHRPLESWSFAITGEVDEPLRWNWDEFRKLPSESIVKDIHCVTKWSKLDTHWEGVSIDTLLDGVETSAEFVLAFSDGGYTTNLPLDDLRGGKAWVAFGFDGEPLEPEHGGLRGCSCRISTSGRARSGCAACSCARTTSRAWEGYGYHNYVDPWLEQRYAGD
jgi:DMSO/TMAO reductase YedYZ molybdopterin-dependent catalytic subunit